ncbi:MAG TPA: hypothetical protein VKG05_04265 [Steroidobacteraceae bacterium]|nr:hypothetical protein [Steroidobacteraceae bacterium]
MRETVLILHADSIAGAQQICAGLQDYDIYLFDPALGDAVAASGLRNVELVTGLGGPPYHFIDRDAHEAAFALEAELDLAQRECETGISIFGWQHLSLYYLLLTLRWYSGLWERHGSRLQQRRIHLLINDNAAEFQANSFLPALPLISYLQESGIAFKTYEYGAKGTPEYPVPDLSGDVPDGESEYILTHLSACFDDVSYLGDEISAAGKPVINLESKEWNVVLPGSQQVGLTDAQNVVAELPAELQDQLDQFAWMLHEAVEQLLSPYIKLPAYRSRQVDQIVHQYRAQLVAYFELQRVFDESVPSKLLLSACDTGFHGPLISFAEERSLPVILLPTGKVGSDIEFTYGSILVLTHPIQGRVIYNPNRRAVRMLPIGYAERFSGTSAPGQGLRTISLLLNAVSLDGIPVAPTEAYIEGIRRIVAWCNSADVALKIRCKPGSSIVRLLNASLGIDAEMLVRNLEATIAEHSRDCDLCLMYDLASTDCLHFLNNSIPTLNPVVTEHTPAQFASCHAGVVPAENLDAVLQRLDSFKSDALTLYVFRDAQFFAYLGLYQAAHPLRIYL